MARRILESLALGATVAFIFGAWDVGLHHDRAAGMEWLAAERLRSFLPAGLGLGVALAALSLLTPPVFGAGLSRARRLGHIVATALVTFLLWRATAPFRFGAWSRLFWDRHALSAAVLGAVALGAIALAAFWAADARRSRSGGGPPWARVRSLAAATVVAAALSWLGVVPLALARRAAGHPSVVVVSLDTLRGDRLGFMGYARPTSPILDGLAAEGAVFERASAASSWTLPSHVSLFTGSLPYDHRILRVGQRVRPELRMLAERFRDSGYRTAAFTGGGYVSWGYGFDQGFEVFEDHDEIRDGGPGNLARHALEWARSHAGEPFFLFVHSYEPHGPYTHGDFANPADRGRLPEARSEPHDKVLADPTPEERRYIADLYDGDIRHADRVLGGLLREMEGAGLLRDAVVVVTSDHGEDLWDHAADDIPAHGHTLYEEILHVPLLLWAPGKIPAGCRLESPVSQLDLPRTLLDLAGIGDRPAFPGRSLASSLRDCAEPEAAAVHAEGVRYAPERFSRREGDLKAIVEPTPSEGEGRHWGTARAIEIYDLSVDPLERMNRAADAVPSERAAIESLLRRIRSTERGDEPGRSRPISPELEEQLRSLGYIR